MAGVGTDHPDDAFAANDLTILAKLFNRRADFHNYIVFVFAMIRPTDKSQGDNSNRTLCPGTKWAKLERALPRTNANNSVPISQFNPKHLVRQNFDYGTFNFDGTFSGHVRISGSDSVINTVCSKWADSEPS